MWLKRLKFIIFLVWIFAYLASLFAEHVLKKEAPTIDIIKSVCSFLLLVVILMLEWKKWEVKNVYSYLSPRKRANVLKFLYIVKLVLLGLWIIGTLIEINVYSHVTAPVPNMQEELKASYLSWEADGYALLLSYVLAIAFLMWVHRIHRNLPALGATGLRQTPGWAVGWYFIPFANLVKPYQGMKDAWNACAPDQAASVSSFASRPGPQLVKIWWRLFIVSNAIDIAVSIMLPRYTTSDLLFASKATLFSIILDGIYTWVALKLIKQLTELQEQKYRDLVSSGWFQSQSAEAGGNREAIRGDD
jgi:hypothetical protein